jgi:hypothetical protein
MLSKIQNLKSKILGCLLLSAFCLLIFFTLFKCPSPVSAQGPIGNVNFAQPFSVTMTSAESTVSVRNIGQAAGSVQYNSLPNALCPIVLEGSANDTNWWTLATSSPELVRLSPTSGLFYANGFNSYYRLVFNPNATTSCNNLTETGTYYGYSAPLPINKQDVWYEVDSLSSVDQVMSSTSGVIDWALDGVQCTNNGSAEAYLQLFSSAATPTLGSGFFYQIGIANGQTFSQNLTGIIGPDGPLWAGASTAVSGSTAGGPLLCDFQVNATGPFYPLLPPGP